MYGKGGRGRFGNYGRGAGTAGGRGGTQSTPREPSRWFAGINSNLHKMHYVEGNTSAHHVETFLTNIKTYCIATYYPGLDNIFEVGGEYPFPEPPDDPLDQQNVMQVKRWEMAEKRHDEKLAKLEEDIAKLFGTILGQMSPESQDRIKETDEGLNAMRDKDALALVKAIRGTHNTAGQKDAKSNCYEALKHYMSISMKGQSQETIPQYKIRFGNEVEAFTQSAIGAGQEGMVPDESMQCIHFVKTLSYEYAGYKNCWERGIVTKSDSIGDTVKSILEFGKDTVTVHSEPQQKGVFVANQKTSHHSTQHKGGFRPSSKPGKCNKCHQEGHWVKECPDWSKMGYNDGQIEKAIVEMKAKYKAEQSAINAGHVKGASKGHVGGGKARE